MPTRPTRQYSERGSLKDIKAQNEEAQAFPYEVNSITLEPTPLELRLQKLYDFSKKNNDQNLLAASGFITTDYIADKNAMPLSVYRLRKTIDDIKSRSPGQIESLCQDFMTCLTPVELTSESNAYWKNKLAMVKTASIRKPPVFRRVSR
jgi:hypothetical protein